jgi:hypothetical protein
LPYPIEHAAYGHLYYPPTDRSMRQKLRRVAVIQNSTQVKTAQAAFTTSHDLPARTNITSTSNAKTMQNPAKRTRRLTHAQRDHTCTASRNQHSLSLINARAAHSLVILRL